MNIRCPTCKAVIQLSSYPDDGLVQCATCEDTIRLESIILGDEGQTATVESPRTDVPSASVGDVVAGRFLIRRKLGQGGFGIVYLAYDRTLEREVALKVPRNGCMTEAQAESFLREARLAAQLNDPNIVSVFEVGREGDLAYIVSQYIAGTTLSKWKPSKGNRFRKLAGLLAKTARSLDRAHKLGVSHRDLKPGNILVDTQDEPHIADFGLGKRNAPWEVDLEDRNWRFGTPPYMSPEQAQSLPTDARSDVFSMGVIMYELLCGQRPFRTSPGAGPPIIDEAPPRPRTVQPRIPADLDQICMKALEIDPDDRYQAADELANDLDRYLSRRAPSTAGLLVRTWREVTRHWQIVVIGLLAVGALIAALAWKRDNRPPPLVGAPPAEPASEATMRRVVIRTTPRAARLVIVPLDVRTGEPAGTPITPSDPTPVELELAPGLYRIGVSIPDYGHHVVYRRVPESGDERQGMFGHQKWTELPTGAFELQSIEIVSLQHIQRTLGIELSQIEGGQMPISRFKGNDTASCERPVDTLWIMTHETTCGLYRRIIGKVPATLQEQPYGEDDPVTFVTFNAAVDFAERIGMRLPTYLEMNFVGTNRGSSHYPWGDTAPKSWPVGPVRIAPGDVLPVDPPVYGLHSNVAEWTDTLPRAPGGTVPVDLFNLSTKRCVYGGGRSVIERDPQPADWDVFRSVQETSETRPGLGFRCVRSVEPISGD